MSSVYRLLCLSHDPAIPVEHPEWPSFQPALAAAKDRTLVPTEHKTCDLLIGQYSYPLIEVCCPASRSMGTAHPGCHSDDRWIDAGWLRLLALADPAAVGAARVPDCWTRDVALRLRYELGLVLPTGEMVGEAA